MRDDEPFEASNLNRVVQRARYKMVISNTYKFKTLLNLRGSDSGMYYDDTQRRLAAMVIRESDLALDEGIQLGIDANDAGRRFIEQSAVEYAVELLQPHQAGEDVRMYRAGRLLDLLVPHERAQDMHANLEEIYPCWVDRHGVRNAAMKLRLQIGILILGNLWERMRAVAGRVIAVAGFGG